MSRKTSRELIDEYNSGRPRKSALKIFLEHFKFWGFFYVIGFLAFIIISDVYIKWFT
jgi:hypothetical protein